MAAEKRYLIQRRPLSDPHAAWEDVDRSDDQHAACVTARAWAGNYDTRTRVLSPNGRVVAEYVSERRKKHR